MSNPTPETVKQALAQLDRALTNPRELARKAVKKFRLDREDQKLPVSNQHEKEVRPTLLVDHILEKSFKQIG